MLRLYEREERIERREMGSEKKMKEGKKSRQKKRERSLLLASVQANQPGGGVVVMKSRGCEDLIFCSRY